MCCGQSRDAARASAAPAYRPPPPQPPPAPAPAPAVTGNGVSGIGGEPGVVRLRFNERSRVRVRGPATGAEYVFSGSEPVRAVHPRDAEGLLRTGFFSRAY